VTLNFSEELSDTDEFVIPDEDSRYAEAVEAEAEVVAEEK